jgi:hypothetical protein
LTARSPQKSHPIGEQAPQYGTLGGVTTGLIIIGRRVGTRRRTLLVGLQPILQ